MTNSGNEPPVLVNAAAPGAAASANPDAPATIAPLDLDFSDLDARTDAGAAAATVAAETASRPSWLLPALGAVCTLLLLVVLFLPRLTGGPAPQLPVETTEVSQAAPAVNEGAPWQEAQRAQQRKAAQAVLEPLLERQLQLRNKAVEQWSSDVFQSTLELAAQGDEHYRNREFAKATASYQQALDVVDELLAAVEPTIEKLLAEGVAAIDAQQADTAKKAFTTVLAIAPNTAAGLQGLQRLEVMDDVEGALSRADELAAGKEFAAAAAEVDKALALDPAREAVLRPRLAELASAARQNDFTRNMSAGYRKLDAGNLVAAEQAFDAATRVQPDNAEPAKALHQVRNKRSLASMQVHFARASKHESAEQWDQAHQAYEAALAIDGNLQQALQRRDYAAQRLKMDKALTSLTNDPLRLADTVIFAKAKKIYRAGRRIDPPGPRLQQQLNLLQRQLTGARQERAVMLLSDGATEVTVKRVANVGAFDKHSLQLIPGRYVAVGSRDGFRDVQREFEVPQGDGVVKVDVRCNEPI